ncbi:MAG: Na+/H+ antiporter subunit D, partial [bacterium]|nr:Na+/H+ antiporter subunit D [bacterium]
EVEAFLVVGVALFVGLLTIYSMTKIWQAAFWSPAPEGVELAGPMPRLMVAPVAVLALLTLVIGFWSGPFIALAEAAATELLDPAGYVAAVLGPAAAMAVDGGLR